VMLSLECCCIIQSAGLRGNNVSDQKLKDIFVRAIRLRCPACGEGRLYRSLLDTHKGCSKCGMLFEREQGYFVGAVYVNVMVTLFLIVSTYLITIIVAPDYDSGVQIILFVMALAIPLSLFRHARSIWLALDYFIDPPKSPRRSLNHG
jgi:uncharacterized protein (DUF983 family)